MKVVSLALDCCSADVAWESTVDISESFAAPITLVVDWVSGRRGATSWNLSRISEAHPRLSLVYLIWSSALTFLLAMMAICGLFGWEGRRPVSFLSVAALSILLGGMLVNAIFFGLVTSLDVNLRYALSNYMVMIAFLLCLILHPQVNSGHVRPHDHRE